MLKHYLLFINYTTQKTNMHKCYVSLPISRKLSYYLGLIKTHDKILFCTL